MRKTDSDADVTKLLADMQHGDESAKDRLFQAIYPELHRIAALYMRRERPDHTLQPTALINEAYVRMLKTSDNSWDNRAHFFAFAARMMRRILVDHARAHAADKRPGANVRLSLDDVDVGSGSGGKSIEVLAVDEALNRLAQLDERQSRVVELRYFAGLSEEETAKVLGVSTRTVSRDWVMAKAWLYDQMAHLHTGKRTA